MPRPSRFSRQDILEASVLVAARAGPHALTMTAVAAAASAPTGSLYHRFASRDELLAEAWVRTMGSFLDEFLPALAGATEPPGLAAAPVPTRRARTTLNGARILGPRRRPASIAPAAPLPL